MTDNIIYLSVTDLCQPQRVWQHFVCRHWGSHSGMTVLSADLESTRYFLNDLIASHVKRAQFCSEKPA